MTKLKLQALMAISFFILGCNKTNDVDKFEGSIVTRVGGAGECKVGDEYPNNESMEYYHYIIKVINAESYKPGYSLVVMSTPKGGAQNVEQLLISNKYKFKIEGDWTDSYIFESVQGDTISVISCNEE